MLAEDPAVQFRLNCVDRLSHGLDFLTAERPTLVLLDLSLPDSHGLETFSKIYAHSPNIPIIVLTGNDDQALALTAVKTGAQDFLVKSKLDCELLVRAMRYSIERKRYQEELEHQANYDELTGLPNRQLLNDRLKQSVFGQRYKRSVAVVFIDVDHFKDVNDSLGHSAGDKLLRSIADRLRSAVREVDTVARLGGDEFVLILHDQARGDVIFRAMQRIIDTVKEPVEIDNRELNITCSAGISLYPQDGPDVETLLKNADTAMYRAKAKGRNNFQFFTAEMNRIVNERFTLEHSLRRALERTEFRLYYQPRLNLRTHSVDAVEALVRWQHPELGLIPPERFMSLAEETGLIVPIGNWVLHNACVQARKWREAGSPVTVSVNLSPRQFWTGDLAKQVAETLSKTGVEPAHLELEFTESMVMHDADHVIAALQVLKSIGIRLSIDDFGTGYSSLSYLRQLPVTAIKIDQAFVRDIDAGGPDGGILAQAIISIGHALNFTVIAEGVETRAQFDFLAAHQCDEVQGYYLGKPASPDECFKDVSLQALADRHASRCQPRPDSMIPDAKGDEGV
jgi:diguanylate cyclase (GGDEF)-like protein